MERGQDYILKIGSTPVGKMTTHSLDRERSLIETNNYDSPDWEESITGMRSWGIETETIYVFNDAGMVALKAAFDSDDISSFTLASRTGASGVVEYTGTGWVTELSLEGSTNEFVKCKISIKGSGPLLP